MQKILAAAGVLLCLAAPALAQTTAQDSAPAQGAPADRDRWNLHGQFTGVLQYHPSFSSPYRGANSLDPGNTGKETTDLTLFAGARLWSGAQIYLNPEVDQGYGLSTTLGIAGFPSGEAYKVGARNPYFRLPRAFLRQSIDLGGDVAATALPDGPNQLAQELAANNLVLTLGKFSVVDVFDTNAYSHDPKGDNMNWSLIDAGAFDYPADAWGFTYGATAEWTQAWWTLRAGAFALSQVPNSKDIDGQFHQFGLLTEGEERHELAGHAGKLKLLVFLNRGHMGRYEDALALARQTGNAPDTGLVRRYGSHSGLALNLEQEVAQDLGVFSRASYNGGAQEAYEFTEINRSLSAGLRLGGAHWGRADDALGVAVAINGLSGDARAYLAAGGMGILIGDGRLPNYGREKILEAYYTWKPLSALALSADYQFVDHPAYNPDRGPVSILGLRAHAEF